MRTTRRIEQVTSDALASEVRSLLDDPAGHLRMEMAQRASVDGQGAGRAAAALVSLVRGG
jgi:hypothetical protein